MFRRLRWRLTLLYLGAGAFLSVSVALSAYGIVSYFFLRSTDRALEHTMAAQMQQLGEPLPELLAEAEETWNSGTSRLLPSALSRAVRPFLAETGEREHEGEEEREGEEEWDEYLETTSDNSLDAELAAIFVSALGDDGRLLPGFNTQASLLVPDRAAVEEAGEAGFDLRTIQVNGMRLRLLTYRLDQLTEPSYLQVGRSLADQDLLLRALLLGMSFLGAVSIAGVGVGSWWMAARTLRPTEQAWQRQREFVANASHELRTPLTIIRSSAEVARRESGASHSTGQLLDDILAETDHMAKLIEDQLLLSRLDAGKLELTLQPVSVQSLLEGLARTVERLPNASGVAVEVHSQACWVRGDPTRLRQVVLILLDNAIRHTPDGGRVTMRARRVADHVEIEVADTGTGIPPEEIEHVFDRFYRVDKARRRSEGGSGLGLPIAKALVEAHNGMIEIKSGPGGSTVVRLRIPALPGK